MVEAGRGHPPRHYLLVPIRFVSNGIHHLHHHNLSFHVDATARDFGVSPDFAHGPESSPTLRGHREHRERLEIRHRMLLVGSKFHKQMQYWQ